ncbi:MAG TPA: hypothetical protein PKD58_03460, partial [Candidatus Sumerlaeota bacterium]|nr:hypothetical protein [Candidatus Sumerlaeota bacterium]
MRELHLFIIAGENSGDIHGSNMLRAMRALDGQPLSRHHVGRTGEGDDDLVSRALFVPGKSALHRQSKGSFPATQQQVLAAVDFTEVRFEGVRADPPQELDRFEDRALPAAVLPQ